MTIRKAKRVAPRASSFPLRLRFRHRSWKSTQQRVHRPWRRRIALMLQMGRSVDIRSNAVALLCSEKLYVVQISDSPEFSQRIWAFAPTACRAGNTWPAVGTR
jgi:hypothetical protein